jgi:hypothetical protein
LEILSRPVFSLLSIRRTSNSLGFWKMVSV